MNIKIELLKSEIADIIGEKLDTMRIDADKIADTTAIKALSEIQAVLARSNIVYGDLADYEIVEEIVNIFEKYELSAEGCHDF